MPRFYDTCAGPISGLYLPPAAWDVLQREKIQTLEQLMGIADRLEQFDGMEPSIAEAVRQALAHASLTGEQTSGEVLLGPWYA